jgi:hypothetical protein
MTYRSETDRATNGSAPSLVVLSAAAVAYILVLCIPDPSLEWAASDETCCHTPTIRAIQEDGLRAALADSHRYRSATTPLYHLLMSLALDRVDPFAIRCAWILTTLLAGFLVYRYVRRDLSLDHSRRAAVALTLAFMLSPTVRASALYFVTDGLAVHLTVLALALLQAARARPLSVGRALPALVAAVASFYTRQYYLWTALFVAYTIFTEGDRRVKLATAATAVLLALPALMIFSIWRGVTPPLGTPIHTTPVFLSTFPNAMGLLAIYAAPLGWVAVRDTLGAYLEGTERPPLRAAAVMLLGAVLYAVVWRVFGFEIPEAGGILRVLNRLGALGGTAFVIISYAGIVLLARWLILDGRSQLWWVVFLLPLLTGSLVLQRYVEPAILVFLFFVARPRDAVSVLDSRLVWFYPVFTTLYGLVRAMYLPG